MILTKTIKFILFLQMFCLGMRSLYSQDVVNPPCIQSVKDAQTGSNPLIQRNPNKFILGWNWGSPCRTLDEALRMNTYHNLNPITSTDLAPNTSLIQQVGAWNQTVIGGRHQNYLSNSHCIHLEPTLPTDANGEVIPRAADNTESVFGFKYKNLSVGRIPTSVGGVDLQRFVLNKYAVSTTPILVLSNIWDGKILRWLDYQESNANSSDRTSHFDYSKINSDEDVTRYHDFNGKKLYLSINLRALTPSEIEANLNNVILTLRLKYKKETRPLGSNSTSPAGEGYIKFCDFPNSGQYEVEDKYGNISQQDFRGTFRRMLGGNIATSTSFQITGAMLKNYLHSSPNNSITLSALAYLTGKKVNNIYVDNPVLKNDWWENYGRITEYISEFDVEVEYHGKLDVAIDWIRIETPRAKTFLRGGYDLAIKEVIDWTMNQARANSASPKISRFYGNDELIPSEWQAMRYYNKLVDGLLAIELFPWNSAYQNSSISKYLYNTAITNYWSGNSIATKLGTGAPYIKKGIINTANNTLTTQSLGYRLGYAGNNWFSYDSLNSGYETAVIGAINNSGYQFKPIVLAEGTGAFSQEWPHPNAYASYGTQYATERQLYFGSFLQPELLYNSKPWWANLWINSEAWVLSSSGLHMNLSDNVSRPKTGEEIRQTINTPIILGAKGLIYWIKETQNPAYNSTHRFLGLMPRNYQSDTNLTGDNLILSNQIGGDYVLTANDPNGFSGFLNSSYYDLNQLGHPIDKVYIGLRSSRFEMQKMHKWIERIESNKKAIPSIYQEGLLDLQLVAWKGKGLTTFYSQDPAAPANIMNNYIKKDLIKTAKLWQPNRPPLNNNYRNAEVNAYVNRWENADSSFYDVTILRPKTFAIGDLNRFYIGVQNRRTDPLVWDVSTNPGRVKFFSTAEYYEGCHSTNNSTALYFNEYYWKKMGCRIISVPLSDQFISTSSNRFAVQVKEILYDDWTFNDQNKKWRNMNWCHLPSIYVADSITNNSTPAPIIDIKLQPGEGKLLKVEKLPLRKLGLINSGCAGSDDIRLQMNVTMSHNDSLVYDLVFENNTDISIENIAVICEDLNNESIDIQSRDNIQTADYLVDNIIRSNSKVVILKDVEPNQKIKIGTINRAKFSMNDLVFRLDVLSNTNEKCTEKHKVLVNNQNNASVSNSNTKVSNISIAPNPAKDMAELHFTATEQGNAEIIVVDILGNQLLRISDYIAYPGANSLNINLSNFSGGVYNVIVKTISGVSTQKFSVVK